MENAVNLTWHAASCNFPNFGRINGAIWLHRNVCTDIGTPKSCNPSSYASRLSLLWFEMLIVILRIKRNKRWMNFVRFMRTGARILYENKRRKKCIARRRARETNMRMLFVRHILFVNSTQHPPFNSLSRHSLSVVWAIGARRGIMLSLEKFHFSTSFQAREEKKNESFGKAKMDGFSARFKQNLRLSHISHIISRYIFFLRTIYTATTHSTHYWLTGWMAVLGAWLYSTATLWLWFTVTQM